MKVTRKNALVLTGGCLLMEADYEGKSSWRHFKVFLEMAPNLLSGFPPVSRVSMALRRVESLQPGPTYYKDADWAEAIINRVLGGRRFMRPHDLSGARGRIVAR